MSNDDEFDVGKLRERQCAKARGWFAEGVTKRDIMARLRCGSPLLNQWLEGVERKQGEKDA